MARTAWLALFLVTVLGCASSEPAPVPVVGDPAELQRLTGEWSGRYDSTATGRSGSIVFHLPADGSGHGDVVMIPLPRIHPRDPHGVIAQAQISAAEVATVINIREIRVANGIISGELVPYQEPNDGFLVTATFRGMVDGERIVGTFTMLTGTRNAPLNGTWSVRRQSHETPVHEETQP